MKSFFIDFAVMVLIIPHLISCDKQWYGEGPPLTLDNTVWVGTNKARSEIIEMAFGIEGAEKGTDNVSFIFSEPSKNGKGRDSIIYGGRYFYNRYPAKYVKGTFKADVSFDLYEKKTMKLISASMRFSNMRFYLRYNNSFYPTDRKENSDYLSILEGT